MKKLKRLLQEIRDFESYRNCLDSNTRKFCENFFKRKLKQSLNEITAKGLVSSFNIIFRNDVKGSSGATIEKIDDFVRATQNTKYHDGYEKIKPNGRTHLEIEKGKFCTKSVFEKEFEKEEFKDFLKKEDLAIKSTPKTFLDRYLSAFDDSGWLISNVENFDDVKDIEIEDLVSETSE